MKYVAMKQRKDRAVPVRPTPRQSEGVLRGTAFDAWLRRGLHALFDDITREPIPEELLRLIEDDRQRTKAGAVTSETSEKTGEARGRAPAGDRKK